MRDETSPDDLSYQSAQVWCYNTHLAHKVGVKRPPVVRKTHDTLREGLDVDHILLRNILPHTDFCGINDALRYRFIVVNKSSKVMKPIIAKILFVLDEETQFGVLVVLTNNLDELGEVP